MTRNDVLTDAVNKCLEELYTLVVPKVSWKEFEEECRLYSKAYKEWELYRKAVNENNTEIINHIAYEGWKDKSITECIGPRPYEFYYLPKEIMKDICDSYVNSYKIDSQQELLNTIEILKHYCKAPIVDKYIEGELREDGTRGPGHRGYEHPDNLEKEIFKIIDDNIPLYQPPRKLVSELQDKFFEFLNMAGNFYNWNRDLNSFNMSVYLGPSPNSNKEAVIENWKKYRNKDIEIDEEKIKKEYYGDEDFDE